MRVLFAITHDTSAQNFLRGQLKYMSEQGMEVHLSCSPGPGLDIIRRSDGPHIHPLRTAREISPVRDIISLFRYIYLLIGLRPGAVHASTPKASLLALVASKLTKVPTRVYLIRGLRLETVRGVKLWLLTLMEKVTCWAATDIVAVSFSLRDEYQAKGLNGTKEVKVLRHGSSNGVDSSLFVENAALRTRARAELDLSPGDLLVTFIGRINLDKGADVFLRMASQLSGRHDLVFLMQGSDEDPALAALRSSIPALKTKGWGDTLGTLAATDVIVLPTLREGFPNVILEAACMGAPAITTTATGARDAVVDGVTGILVRPGDVESLSEAVMQLSRNAVLRRQMGAAAKQRALTEFKPQDVWAGVYSILVSRVTPSSHP